MESAGVLDKDCPFAAMFQQVINEMKNCTPLWEELIARSTKLHGCLRAEIQAWSPFLDTLQKIADAATATRGASKDIGTGLTRLCLRYKAKEAKMKTFTSSMMDCLILPLQDKVEDWKKTTVQLEKNHAKEYKRARSELKKRSIETARLQKKLKKGSIHNGGMGGSFTGTLPRNHGSGVNNSADSANLFGGNRDSSRILEVALRDTADKRQAFEESEKQAIRSVLVEERSRFALFVSYLKPVVDEEVGMLYELTHVQEAMQQLEKHAADPFSLPTASEQVIADLKGSCDSGAWSFQTPPSSPSSLGSRKSSMCSISSANSSSSGSHSPSHKVHHRTINHQPVISGQVGTLRYSSVSSQDSGFTSQDTLYSRYTSFFPQHKHKTGNQSEGSNASSTASSNSSTPSSPYPPGNTTLTTWPNAEDSMQFQRAACAIMNERPHTISSAYERGHQRPPITVYTFQPPNPNDPGNSGESPSTPIVVESHSHSLGGKPDSKPPVPKRCSSLERPQSATSMGPPKPPPSRNKSKDSKKQQQQQAETNSLNKIYASNVPDFNQSSEDMIVPQPVYVNMHDLSQMAKEKKQRQGELDLPPPPPDLMGSANKMEYEANGTQSGCVYATQNQIGAGEDSRNTSGIYGYTGGREGCPGRQPNTASSGSNSRRNSCGAQEKPAPPIRRNSSISASPSRNSPVPMMSHNQSNSSPNSTMNNYQSSPMRQNSSPPVNPNSCSPPGYPIYIQNPTYSHNGSSSVHNSNSLSSGSQGSSMDSGETTPHASMESLPPPPAYLIVQNCGERRSSLATATASPEDAKRGSVAETVKNLMEKNHHPVSPRMVRRAQSLKQSHEDPRELRSSPSSRRGSTSVEPNTNNNNKSRSNLIQALNQKLAQHQTHGSPSPTATSAQNSQPIYQQLTSQQQYSVQSQSIYSQIYQSQQPQPIYQQILPNNASLQSVQDGSQSQQHHSNGAPRTPRRFSEELLKTTATFVQNRVLGNCKTPPPIVTSKDIFVQTLNAKLSQMRSSPPIDRKNSYPFTQAPHVQAQNQPLPNPKPTSFASKLVASVSSHQKGNSVGEISRAFRVRQWISSKTVPDPTACRDSLMDQIRRGTKLKPTRTVNDRSSPKVNH